MTDLSKRLRVEANRRAVVSHDERGGRVSPEDYYRVKGLLTEAADALEWKPIADAPMDGTPVLVFCPNEEPQIVAAKYVTDSEWSGWVFVEMLLQETMPEGPEGPTHFMPIPSPPVGE